MLEQANRARDVERRERMNQAFEAVQKLSHSPIPLERTPYTHLPSLPTSSNDPPAQDPSQFALGSMVSVPTQCGDPLYGVVMWIGTLPEFPGVLAGVELVSHIALIHYMLT